jgi:hypothetical protein
MIPICPLHSFVFPRRLAGTACQIVEIAAQLIQDEEDPKNPCRVIG